MTTALPKLLLVDDEPLLLSGLKRQLKNNYDVTTAEGGSQALSLTDTFEIVVSDMRMPEMDGATFLKKFREKSPDTIRILLTGQTDVPSAIAAVNEGGIFRFLTKPVTPETLNLALKAALQQYHLIMAERELLEKTLRGSLKTLSDVLSLAHPEAFTRSQRLMRHLQNMIPKLTEKPSWTLEIAFMFSQIGCVMLPPTTFEKWQHGDELTTAEKEMLGQLPLVSEKVLSSIPRLEEVCHILRYQNKNYDGSGVPNDSVSAENIPWQSRLLKILLDYDLMEHQKYSPKMIIDILRGRQGYYDQNFLKIFAESLGTESVSEKILEVPLSGLKPGLFLADDIFSKKKQLLMPKGQEVTPILIERLMNFSQSVGVREPIRISTR